MRCTLFYLFILIGIVWSTVCDAGNPYGGERTGSHDIVGVWTVDIDSAFHVEILEVNGIYEGTVIWLRDSINGEGRIKKDELNPNPDLRTRTFKGIKVVQNMEFKESGHYCCGELYDPESGNTYKCRITLPNPNIAEIRGFIGIPLLGKTVVFRRVFM